VTLTPAYVATNPAARPGDYVRLTLAHSGAERQADLDGVFEPQFAAAESGAGYELGLAMAYGLVQQLGGFIEVTQQVAEETVWDVYLPAWLAEEAGVPGSAGAEVQGSAARGAEEQGGEGAGEQEAAAQASVEQPAVAEQAETAGANPVGPAVVMAQQDMEGAAAPQADAESAAQAGEGSGVPTVVMAEQDMEEAAAPEEDEGPAEGAGEIPAWLQADTEGGGAPQTSEELGAQVADEIPGPPAAPAAANDIASPMPELHEIVREAASDITEEEPPTAKRSGLARLGSSLRQRLGRKRETWDVKRDA
jgi:hypothetical protein